jgi:hypothetical protein
VREGHGEDAVHPEHVERVARDGVQRVRDDAAPPVLAPEPVADLRGEALDVLPGPERDRADRGPLRLADDDGERRRRVLPRDARDVRLGVGRRVRVREQVAQVQPDVAVVRVARDRSRVPGRERAQAAGRADELHGAA